jgi:hypothetical protein
MILPTAEDGVGRAAAGGDVSPFHVLSVAEVAWRTKGFRPSESVWRSGYAEVAAHPARRPLESMAGPAPFCWRTLIMVGTCSSGSRVTAVFVEPVENPSERCRSNQDRNQGR